MAVLKAPVSVQGGLVHRSHDTSAAPMPEQRQRAVGAL
jgi:hypothetical protein